MAKSRKRNQRYNKYKKGFGPTPQRVAQTRLSRMESRLTPFVKKDENGKVIGVELPEDSTNSVNPLCPKCQAPMELKRPRADQKWPPFWGCSMYSLTGCKGDGKGVSNKRLKEPIEYEAPTIESVVGNQNKTNELEIVKKNKQGEYFVNKSIQSESKGSLSWNDVIDLIDEALDDAQYPETIFNQLEDFREQILAKIKAEQGIVLARKAPKTATKEPEKNFTNAVGHTYNEIAQNKDYKAEAKKGRSVVSKKRVIRQQKSIELLKQLKPKSFGKPKNQNNKTPNYTSAPNCPTCQGMMRKKMPKQEQAWKPFWSCIKYPKCKGTVSI